MSQLLPNTKENNVIIKSVTFPSKNIPLFICKLLLSIINIIKNNLVLKAREVLELFQYPSTCSNKKNLVTYSLPSCC